MNKDNLTAEEIITAYYKNGKNWTKTAASFGIGRRTLFNLRKKLNVDEKMKKPQRPQVATNDLYDAIASYLPEEQDDTEKNNLKANAMGFVGVETFGRKYTQKELNVFHKWGTRIKNRPQHCSRTGIYTDFTDEELARKGFIHSGDYYLYLPAMEQNSSPLESSAAAHFDMFDYKTKPYDPSIHLHQTYEEYKEWKGRDASTPLLTEEEYKQKQDELRANLEDELAALNDGACLV